jgi:hypothetical protein
VARVTGDSSLQTEVLEDLSDARAYRRWLADLARPYLGPHPVEIGSGRGDHALEWTDSVDRLTCTEADHGRFKSLAARFADHEVIQVRHLLLGDDAGIGHGAGGHSAAVAFNVLEHIPDDVAALQAMGSLVQPGGAIVLVVPAFPSAMAQFDRAIGHQRRYTRASLGTALRDAGLEIEQLRYVNPIGLLIWYVVVKALRVTPGNGLALRLYDRTVVPVARALDRFAAPFGQSVFAVARVPHPAGRSSTI